MSICKMLRGVVVATSLTMPAMAIELTKPAELEMLANLWAQANAVQLRCPELHPSSGLTQAVKEAGPKFFAQYDMDTRVRAMNILLDKDFRESFHRLFSCSAAWEQFGLSLIPIVSKD
jgi:hypothetical protein